MILNDVFDVVVVVLKLRLMLMVRLLSRIMSMMVLMACIRMHTSYLSSWHTTALFRPVKSTQKRVNSRQNSRNWPK